MKEKIEDSVSTAHTLVTMKSSVGFGRIFTTIYNIVSMEKCSIISKLLIYNI